MAREHVCLMILTVNSISCVLSETASGLYMFHVRALKNATCLYNEPTHAH
jgi:hypothetical protein